MSRDLTQSLARAREALERARPGNAALERHKGPGPVATGFGALALVLFVVAFLTGNHALLYVALAAAAAGGVLFASPQARELLAGLAGLGGGKGQAQVGMGATVAADAILEPGARVEMGASVAARAVIRGDAVVRMGASVGKDAVIERGAVVSWGASVHAGAVVEEGATVGAGSDVLARARVPAGMWLRPGSTFGGSSSVPVPARRVSPEVADPRAARIAAACDKLEAELRASPGRVREFLGGSGETVAALRLTCEDLLRRERELRGEADAAAMARLDEERAALEKRIGAERDEQIASSLRGAIGAIDEQKRQRDILKLRAERLEAEQTRLLYTLEGLASQFVRLRTSGSQAGAEVDASVAQLRNELDAIADALDEVSVNRLAAVAEAPAMPGEEARPRRTRVPD